MAAAFDDENVIVKVVGDVCAHPITVPVFVIQFGCPLITRGTLEVTVATVVATVAVRVACGNCTCCPLGRLRRDERCTFAPG